MIRQMFMTRILDKSVIQIFTVHQGFSFNSVTTVPKVSCVQMNTVFGVRYSDGYCIIIFQVKLKPSQLSHDSSCTLPYASLVTWQALVNEAGNDPIKNYDYSFGTNKKVND